MAYNNKGIIIVKKPPHLNGSLQVIYHDPLDPKFAQTANQQYASHTVNTPAGKEVGDVVKFDWQGTGPYTATNLQ